MKVGLHQGSLLSLLLFVIVMEMISRELRAVLPLELLYADDLILMAESEESQDSKMEIRVGSKRFEDEYRKNEVNVQLLYER